MKILLTLDFPPERGGMQRYLENIVLHRWGEGDIVLVGSSISRPDNRLQSGALIRYLSTPFSRWSKKLSLGPVLVRFRNLMRAFPDATVECGNVYAAIVPWVLSLVKNQPYRVYTYATELLALKHASLKAMVLRSVLGRAARLYALGSYTQELLREAGISTATIVEPPRIAAPANAPDCCRLKPDLHPVRILSVGRLVEHKGHRVLLEALRKLDPSLRWHCVIAGNGPFLGPLLDECRNRNLESRVEIRTDISDDALSQEYRRATIFAFPSVPARHGVEGFGIALLDAMAHGVPIVASRTGGIPEVVGGNALLVEPGDSTGLANAISRLAHDGRLRCALATRACGRLMENYVW
jgi:glycosyltransferase involved in cell wall biosynthesis